jgi:hypothetical protein
MRLFLRSAAFFLICTYFVCLRVFVVQLFLDFNNRAGMKLVAYDNRWRADVLATQK